MRDGDGQAARRAPGGQASWSGIAAHAGGAGHHVRVALGKDDDVPGLPAAPASRRRCRPSRSREVTTWYSMTCSTPGMMWGPSSRAARRLGHPGRRGVDREEHGARQAHGAQHLGQRVGAHRPASGRRVRRAGRPVMSAAAARRTVMWNRRLGHSHDDASYRRTQPCCQEVDSHEPNSRLSPQ